MGELKLIAMNERILGHTCVYLATPVDFAGADDIITKNWQRREPTLGSRLSNGLSDPVLIITSFHIYKVAKGIHK